MEAELIYKSEGFAEPNVMTMVSLIVGTGMAVLVLIFVGVLGGQVYSQTEPDIEAITDNTTKEYVKQSIQYGFKALKQTGTYLPIVVIAVVITIVLGLVFGLTAYARPGAGAGMGGYGGAYYI